MSQGKSDGMPKPEVGDAVSRINGTASHPKAMQNININDYKGVLGTNFFGILSYSRFVD